MTVSKIYEVKFPNGFTTVVLAATEADAMADAYANMTTPRYCRIHAGIKDRSDAPVGEMGHFTPVWPQPSCAQEMREVYMDAGYSLIAV